MRPTRSDRKRTPTIYTPSASDLGIFWNNLKFNCSIFIPNMASAPDTTSIPGYTIFREGDYDSVAATAMLPQGTPHPLG